MQKRTIIRKAHDKKNPYAQISRQLLQDPILSWAETGLLGYLLSLPDHWEINLADLARRKRDGRHSSRSALNGLISKGYVEKTVFRDEKGKFHRFEYLVHETSTHPLSNIRIMDTSKETYASDVASSWLQRERAREAHQRTTKIMLDKDMSPEVH